MKKKVLVTYGWCRTSYVAAKSLSRAGYDVYVCDSSSLAMSRFSRHVRGFFKACDPFTNREQYRKDISDICIDHQIDYVLPAHEDGVFLTGAPPESSLYKKVVYADKQDVERAVDKFKIMSIASKAGLPTPETHKASSLKEALGTIDNLLQEFGVAVIKPRWGNSGKGLRIIRSLNEAKIALKQYNEIYKDSNSPFPLVQEYVAGDVYGACFLALNGDIKYFFGERYICCKSNGMGTSVLREPYHWKRLEIEARKLVESLGWNGLGHLDFIGDGKTNISFLEMNPRLWGGINNAVANGFDFPAAVIAHADNQPSLQEYFTCRDIDRKTMWILGELISIIDDLKVGGVKKMVASFRALFEYQNVSYDDFCISDPVPFFAQCVYYLKGFLMSGGNINPDRPDMM